MTNFQTGQRWLSDSESELGLGLVKEVSERTVTLAFPACDETRVYARSQAPLSRVSFGSGDKILDRQGESLIISTVEEAHGVLTYTGHDSNGQLHSICETELHDSLKLNRPQDRLLSAQVDPERAYVLRYDTLHQQQKLAPSAVRGLLGPRVDLIPHQFYIAHEVSSRTAPRVLLADEVGLGKTIEAGLILHQQLISGRAQRVLIVVPDSLLHQWLVEMLRRFNLRFNLFDQNRCAALAESGENPFHSEQLILCSLEMFMHNPERQEEAAQGEWDLLIVDEAHHLHWDEQCPSMEYQFIERLALCCPGLLLLTATPEQLGPASHFARLRLLDPHRFYDLQQFLQEEQRYIQLAQAVEPLLEAQPLSAEQLQVLNQHLDQDGQQLLQQLDTADTVQHQALRQQLITQLVDRHGSGRVLFRNTRNTIKGFPPRQLHAYPLESCTAYQQTFATALSAVENRQTFAEQFRLPYAQLMLMPELAYQTLFELGATDRQRYGHWTQFDPRVPWLVETLTKLRQTKVLVICANAHTALELEEYLHKKHALRAAVFHEGLSIIERDRAAAYFADTEQGAQILICSEIGSEGRNFQFAHHLILFDLPFNPDLLEQRIGRLDRIGQRHIINIHVPYIKESAQELMFHWYHDVLNAFNQTCPAGQGMQSRFASELEQLFESHSYSAEHIVDLINKAQPVVNELNRKLQSGRDRLLELNAFHKPVADAVLTEIQQLENESILEDYMNRVCDTFGVEFTEHSAHSYVIRPSDHMLTEHFPELPEDGVVACFNRQTALVHEDRLYLTWEHPMVSGAMDMVLDGEHGNVAFSIIRHKAFPAGTVLLESLFMVRSLAPRQYQADRFLPPQLLRYLVNLQLQDVTSQLAFSQCQHRGQMPDKEIMRQVIGAYRTKLRDMLQSADKFAHQALPQIQTTALQSMTSQLDAQLARLRALQQRNPNVREEELIQLAAEKAALTSYLSQPQLHLDAVRLIICS